MIKWEFYSVLAEELLMYTDKNEMEGSPAVVAPSKMYMNGHTARPYFLFDKSEIIKQPVCMICSMEESVRNKVFSCSPVASKGRKQSRRVKFLAKCTNPFCDVVVHTCNPEESTILKLSTFQGLSCFEIAHTNECNGLFYKIQRKGHHYM